MRAFLVMLMLTLLPLQFSAAAAASCCGHASALQSPPALHPQATPAQLAGTVDGMASVSSCFDLNCGVCQSHCMGAITTHRLVAADPAGAVQAEHIPQRVRQASDEPPYRPKWPAPNSSGFRAFA